MNRLEEYIRDHRNRFDEEPASGHFERLQQKMNRKSKRTVALRWSISIAASIAIVFLAGIIRQHSERIDDSMAICENAVDMKLCYLDKMNAVAGRIEMLTKHLDPWDQRQVMTDVKNIINTVDGDFESEIPEELPINKAKLILSDYYLHNLKSLEMIEGELKNYETTFDVSQL